MTVSNATTPTRLLLPDPAGQLPDLVEEERPSFFYSGIAIAAAARQNAASRPEEERS